MCLGNRKEKGERREEEREKQKEGGCQEVREEGTERGRVKGKKREGRFFSLSWKHNASFLVLG